MKYETNFFQIMIYLCMYNEKRLTKKKDDLVKKLEDLKIKIISLKFAKVTRSSNLGKIHNRIHCPSPHCCVKYGKNLAKNEGKPCSTCLRPIFQLILDTRKADFEYPFHH